MNDETNPFSTTDPDRHSIWEMLVRQDIEGFVAQDWTIFGGFFRRDGFCGLDAEGSLDPKDWWLRFPTVDAYRTAWLADAKRAAETAYAEDRRSALYRATTMRDVTVQGDTAIARKTFDDGIALHGGGVQKLNWQSVFFCARSEQSWTITGFIGFMAFDSVSEQSYA
ncbi:hypothetical protein C8J35_111101 [Rhizobium sp. PP-F2F-G38]|nr:hypothetical protein C8J37_11921 [Rhizobium sp. PP-WC-1G-195]PYE94045.1 hypothetical protein C8J35_111101 [Rhizobium sp. PP-F2F-G38]